MSTMIFLVKESLRQLKMPLYTESIYKNYSDEKVLTINWKKHIIWHLQTDQRKYQ